MRTSTHDTILPLDRRRKSAVVHRGAGAARPAACRHLAPRDGPSADPSGGAQHSRSAARPAGLRGWRKCASTVAPWTTSVCGAMGAARRELLGSASGSHAARHAPEVRPARRAEGSCAAAVARAGGSGRPRHTQKERRRRLQPGFRRPPIKCASIEARLELPPAHLPVGLRIGTLERPDRPQRANASSDEREVSATSARFGEAVLVAPVGVAEAHAVCGSPPRAGGRERHSPPAGASLPSPGASLQDHGVWLPTPGETLPDPGVSLPDPGAPLRIREPALPAGARFSVTPGSGASLPKAGASLPGSGSEAELVVQLRDICG